MDLTYVIAVVRVPCLEAVEQSLLRLGIRGFTVIKVKGRGAHPESSGVDWLSRDWLMDDAKIEIVTDASKLDAVTSAIMNAAHTGDAGDGIISVLPVSRFYRIRTRSEVLPGDA